MSSPVDLHATAGLVAGIVALLAFVPYIASIIRGVTRPSLTSWFIWTLVGVMIVASYRASGATHTLWVAGSYVLGPLIVTLLSLRYGERGTTTLDWVCLTISVGSLIPWWLLRSAPSALALNILADVLGAVPTIRKSWMAPESEDRLAWLIAFLANCINLLAVAEWTPRIYAYPLYAFATTGVVAGILCIRQSNNGVARTPAVGTP